MKINFIMILVVAFFIFLFAGISKSQTDNKQEKEQHKSSQEKSLSSENCPSKGVARLRVTFDKSGKITNVELVLSAGCKYFDELAVAAAWKIKFKPAKKDGKRITVVKQLEYTFGPSN